MRDLDDKIRESLERLADSGDERRTDMLWSELVARRRRRRVRKAALAALPVLLIAVLALGLFTSNRSDDALTDVATGGDGPTQVERWGVRASQAVVAEFLDDLRDGDVDAAAERWTGYPQLGPDGAVSERVQHIEELMADPTFARILVSDTTTTFVTPSTDEAGQVVTVLDARTGEKPPTAIAFLTGWIDEQGNPGDMLIQRLPVQGPTTNSVDLPAGSYAAPGQEIVVLGIPLEGGARAFVNDQEIPVEVDHKNLTMTISIPAGAKGDIAVTVVTSSPELAGVFAFAVTVRP